MSTILFFSQCSKKDFFATFTAPKQSGTPSPDSSVTPSPTNTPIVNFKHFTPALIVQNTACLTCHATLKGSLMTDFGLPLTPAPYQLKPLGLAIKSITTLLGLNVSSARVGEYYMPTSDLRRTLLAPISTASLLITNSFSIYVPPLNVQFPQSSNPDCLEIVDLSNPGCAKPSCLPSPDPHSHFSCNTKQKCSLQDVLSLMSTQTVDQIYSYNPIYTSCGISQNYTFFSNPEKINKINTLSRYLNFVQNYRTDSYIDYINNEFIPATQPTPLGTKKLNTEDLPSRSKSKLNTVREINKLDFFFPSSNDVRKAFNINSSSTKSLYLNTENKPSNTLPAGFSLMTYNNLNIFIAKDYLKCEGDLFLDGFVYLQDLQLSTQKGCRIYATEGVFLYAINRNNNPSDGSNGIEYIDPSPLSNLQIFSTSFIIMGIGTVGEVDYMARRFQDKNMSCILNPACKNMGLTADPTNRQFSLEYSQIVQIQNFFATQSAKYPNALLDASVLATENAQIADPFKISSINDVQKRKVNFDKILLFAPHIQSRYTGNISGTIIARFLLPALASFHYAYNAVFENVDFLPQLNSLNILQLQDCICNGAHNVDYSTADPDFPEIRKCPTNTTKCNN